MRINWREKSGFAVPSFFFLKKINGFEKKRAGMKTNGSPGLSGLDAGE